MDTRVFTIEIDSSGAARVLDDLDRRAQKVDKSTEKLDGSTGRLSKTQSSASKEVANLRARYVSYGAIIGAVGTAITASIVQFSRYEKAIAEVNTLLDESQSISDYSDSVRELSRQFGTSNVQQAQALYQVISAGASNATSATNILTAANKLAIGGVTDIQTAADGLTSIINAYSLSSDQASTVSDILFSTMRAGKTTIGELSQSLGQVAPIASQVGVDFGELTAAIGTITTSGVATSQAVTQVRAALSNVLKPSAEASALAQELGLDFSVAGLRAQGFAGFIEQASEATGGSEEQLAKLFGSIEAVQAVLPLAGAQAERFAEVIDANANSAGQTQIAFEKMTDTLDFNYNQLVADVQDLAVQFGSFLAPAADVAVDVLQVVVATLSFIGEGLGLVIDLVSPLVESLSRFSGISLVWEQWNKQLEDSNSFLSGFAEAFDSIDVFRARFIRGALIGFEEINRAAEIGGAGLKLAFIGAFDLILESYGFLVQGISDGLNAVGLDGFSEDVGNFAESIRNVITPLDDFEASVARINAQADTNIRQINTITADMEQYARQALESEKNSAKLASAIQDVSTSSSEASTQTSLYGDSVDKIIKAERDRLQEVEDLNTAIDLGADLNGVLQKRLDQLTRSTKEVTKEFGGYGTAAKQAVGIVEDFNESQAEQAALLEEINNIFPESARQTDAYKEALRAAGVETEETTTVMSQAWERFRDSSFDALQTFYRDGLDGAKDFGDSIEDLFKDMVANVLAQITSLVASNAFKSLVGFITGNPTGGGLFDGIGSVLGVGGSSGGGNLISSALGVAGINPASIGASIASAIGLTGAGAASAAAAGVGVAGIGGAGIGAAGISGGVASGATAASGAGIFGSIGTAVSTGFQAVGSAISGAYTAVLGALGPVGAAAAAIATVAALVGSGSRSPLQLGLDQLQAVDDATREGRNEQVALGESAGVSLSFLGGFDENSTFFGVDLLQDQLQQVGDVLQERFGFNQALALKDGVIRLEDFSREFSKNNDDIVNEVRAAIVEVELEVTQLERTTIGSLGSTLLEVDRLFDATAGNGQTTAERISQAYSSAFDTTIEAGRQWVNQSGIDANRIGEIFDASSDLVTQNLFGITESGTQAFSELGDFAEFEATRIGGAFSGLNGVLNNVDLGTIRNIQLPVLTVQQSTQQQNVVQNSSRVNANIDIELVNQILASNLENQQDNLETRRAIRDGR